MQQGEGSEAQVTWEDQQNINRFGRLNNRFHELEDEIKLAKEVITCLLCNNCEVFHFSFNKRCVQQGLRLEGKTNYSITSKIFTELFPSLHLILEIWPNYRGHLYTFHPIETSSCISNSMQPSLVDLLSWLLIEPFRSVHSCHFFSCETESVESCPNSTVLLLF